MQNLESLLILRIYSFFESILGKFNKKSSIFTLHLLINNSLLYHKKYLMKLNSKLHFLDFKGLNLL